MNSQQLTIALICGSTSLSFDTSLIKIVSPGDLTALGPEDSLKLEYSVEGFVNLVSDCAVS